jgi:hypothetical protein
MRDLLWGAALAAAMWLGAAAGVIFGDWRDARAGRPIDRGFFPALPGDPDYPNHWLKR